MVKTSPMQAINAAWGGNRPPNPVTRTFQETRQDRPITSILPTLPVPVSGTSAVLIAQAGDTEFLRLDFMVAYNQSGGVSTLNIYLTDATTAAAGANQLYRVTTLATLATDQCTPVRGVIIPKGGRLFALCNPGPVNITASFTRISQGQS